MTLILSPQVESRLVQGARLNGLSPEAYAETLLLRVLPEPSEKTERTEEPEEDDSGGSAYDLFKDLLGGWSSGGSHLSENCGEAFAEGMAQKKRQGHL